MFDIFSVGDCHSTLCFLTGPNVFLRLFESIQILKNKRLCHIYLADSGTRKRPKRPKGPKGHVGQQKMRFQGPYLDSHGPFKLEGNSASFLLVLVLLAER